MNSRLATLTTRIKQEANKMGFTLVGVTSPSPPMHFDVYQHWIEAGRHGAMSYLAAGIGFQRRADPCRILPECQSILVAAMNYLPKIQPKEHCGQAKIASYALGQDYHHVLEARLHHLVEIIEHLIGSSIPHRVYADTGPLLEREFAQRAGLGWIGKNTCLIHPKLGSHFALGEVLLGTELQADKPFHHDYCGTCSRCSEACPTHCILPDRTIDARRCISYLTIEFRDVIPHELRPLMGTWIFGCDICQQVCPWNQRFAKVTKIAEIQPHPILTHALIEDFLALEPETYRRLFQHSPLKRPKYNGVIRNALVAAGNSGDVRLLPQLVRWLHDDTEPLLRIHAAWSVGRMKCQPALDILQKASRIENDPLVFEEIQRAINEFHTPFEK